MTVPPVVMRDVIVVGGGCYGTFYAMQLAKARQRGRAVYGRLIVVDRDPQCRAAAEIAPFPDHELRVAEWEAFFDGYLDRARSSDRPGEQDVIVPSPYMPHLMCDWLLRQARRHFPDRIIEVATVPGDVGTPYDRVAEDGTRYVSFADWVCPTHCIEPALCPAIGSPRTWEMPEAVRALAERMRRDGARVLGSAVFVCRHTVFGVGTFAVDAVLDGAHLVERAARRPEGGAVLVGTVSSCHGALNLLTIGPHGTSERDAAG